MKLPRKRGKPHPFILAWIIVMLCLTQCDWEFTSPAVEVPILW